MKTKLTLTIKKHIVKNAKRYSKSKGKSISQLFEELFENIHLETRSKNQIVAERLLRKLEGAKQIKTLEDKKLLRQHVADKYA